MITMLCGILIVCLIKINEVYVCIKHSCPWLLRVLHASLHRNSLCGKALFLRITVLIMYKYFNQSMQSNEQFIFTPSV